MIRSLALILILLALAPAAAAPQPPTGELVMNVNRDGDRIGRHVIIVRRHGARLSVYIDVEVRVRIAFITVYVYRQKGRETWENGRLIAYEAEVDDDGDIYRLTARATPKGLVVEGRNGRVVAPPGTMMSGYWNMATVKQTRLVDATEGKILNIAVSGGEAVTVTLGGRAIAARHYRLDGDMKRDLWYDADGRLLKMRSIARDGSVIDTVRR